MLGRRELLGTVGVAAVAVGALRNSGTSAPEPGRVLGSTAAVATTDELDLLAEAGLRAHARFGTCEVLGLEREDDGVVVVRLADGTGQSFDVEILGHDRLAPGVARAGSLGVYLKNRGRGTSATIEEHGLAAMALARHLARREAAGAKLPVLPTLLERSMGAVSARV